MHAPGKSILTQPESLFARMTIRPTKCIFGARCVDFLGHRLEQGVLGLHEENVEKIKNAPRPGTKSKFVRLLVWLDITETLYLTLQLLQLPYRT